MRRLIVATLTLFTLSVQMQAQATKTTPLGKGIRFIAEDSSMSIKFQARIQNLFELTHDIDGDSYSSRFRTRRARLKFSGHAFDPRLTYKMEFGLSSNDIGVGNEDGNSGGGARIVLDAVLKYKFCKNWAVWIGQTKLPGNRERVVSSANLQLVDRSLVNSRFNIDRDVGVQLHGKYLFGSNLVIKPKLAWTMGEGRDITTGNKGGYNYTGRLEILPVGEFTKKGDYFLADLVREESPKIAFGFTYNINDRAVRQQGQLGRFVRDSTGAYAENTLSSFQADMIFKYRGFSVLSEFATTSADKEIEGLSSNYNTGTGFNIQAGYVFPSYWEIAARYTMIRPDEEAFSGITGTNEYTLGLSRYIVGHNLKIQSDIGYSEDSEGAGDDKSLRFRFQTEFQF